jgi:hypothetical protein
MRSAASSANIPEPTHGTPGSAVRHLAKSDAGFGIERDAVNVSRRMLRLNPEFAAAAKRGGR